MRDEDDDGSGLETVIVLGHRLRKPGNILHDDGIGTETVIVSGLNLKGRGSIEDDDGSGLETVIVFGAGPRGRWGTRWKRTHKAYAPARCGSLS